MGGAPNSIARPPRMRRALQSPVPPSCPLAEWPLRDPQAERSTSRQNRSRRVVRRQAPATAPSASDSLTSSGSLIFHSSVPARRRSWRDWPAPISAEPHPHIRFSGPQMKARVRLYPAHGVIRILDDGERTAPPGEEVERVRANILKDPASGCLPGEVPRRRDGPGERAALEPGDRSELPDYPRLKQRLDRPRGGKMATDQSDRESPRHRRRRRDHFLGVRSDQSHRLLAKDVKPAPQCPNRLLWCRAGGEAISATSAPSRAISKRSTGEAEGRIDDTAKEAPASGSNSLLTRARPRCSRRASAGAA